MITIFVFFDTALTISIYYNIYYDFLRNKESVYCLYYYCDYKNNIHFKKLDKAVIKI